MFNRREVMIGSVALAALSREAAAQSQFADLDALIKAARAEGEMTFYSGSPQSSARRAAKAFTDKYGVGCSFTRLQGNPLKQRYASEADAGKIAADVVLTAGGVVPFAEECIRKGWAESLESANLPALTSGEFPQHLRRGPVAIVQLLPWIIIYNTDKVKGADIPKNWPDLLDPKWKGSIAVIDPSVSEAFLDIWALVADKYGPDFFTKLMAQQPKLIAQSSVAVQSLVAGEYAFVVPQTPENARLINNAPIDIVVPPLTTSVEIMLMLTARSKAKSPSAARLFANFILSKEGNDVLNDNPDTPSIYKSGALPAEYSPTKPETPARRNEILKLFGIAG